MECSDWFKYVLCSVLNGSNNCALFWLVQKKVFTVQCSDWFPLLCSVLIGSKEIGSILVQCTVFWLFQRNCLQWSALIGSSSWACKSISCSIFTITCNISKYLLHKCLYYYTCYIRKYCVKHIPILQVLVVHTHTVISLSFIYSNITK